jgi:GxxExxY protein
LEIELRQRDIPSVPQKPLLLKYKNLPLKQTYTPDLICYEKIIVELKATSALSPEHMSQVINYLKATGLRLGLLVNFGHHPGLQCQRVVL